MADLTPDERHVLRSVSLLDAFDEDLATQTAGLPHRAAARRLIERPFVQENPFGLWPHHLHGLIRSTIRSADDLTDDRWPPTGWERAAVRAHAALGEQWTAGADRDRLVLVGCLRQGLALARGFRLDLGWLTDAAWAYVSDSVWEPVAPAQPTDRDDAVGAGAGLETAADASASAGGSWPLPGACTLSSSSSPRRWRRRWRHGAGAMTSRILTEGAEGFVGAVTRAVGASSRRRSRRRGRRRS
ncbi:hypothetical protein [Streptomyces sp. NPDC052494]|uniref:hypothetical protein n=1 Tax=Streptomyces sp. NPDC052494 TaxID=3365692 RepID=UPI0037D7D568